jgi:phosphatidylserine decarboxylase
MAAPEYPHPIIAREGWVFLGAALALALALSWSGPWALAAAAWLGAAFIAQFFRDPPRVAPAQANVVLSPADGRVVLVGHAHDPYLDREAVKISVFMNVFNVHSNRSPVDGEVKNKWRYSGRFFNAALDKASLENERCALHVTTAENVDITCVQIAGLIARRVLCYVAPGDRLARGQRYGFIRFGSRVDVYLPAGAKPRVAVGDAVQATTSVVAELP